MFTFKKEERLCSKKLLDGLFSNGSSFLVYPFKVTHLRQTLEVKYPVQVVIVVPKRRFKRANQRNLIKRRIREAYRLHKSELLYPFLQEQKIQLLLSFQYVGKEIEDFKLIEKKLLAVFKQLFNIYGPGDNKVN